MKPIQKKVLFLLVSLIYLILYEILQLTKKQLFENSRHDRRKIWIKNLFLKI